MFELNNTWFDIKAGDMALSQYGPVTVLWVESPSDHAREIHGRYSISLSNGSEINNYPGYLLHKITSSNGG